MHYRSDGAPLPGAEIEVRQTGQTAITDERGAFTISDIPGGRYDITATLPGFRTQALQASVPQLPADQLKFVLRIGLLAETHWVPFEPSEAVQTADAIAHVRLEGLTPSKPQCADIDTIVAVHNATVVSVWKGRLPAKIQIFEDDAGSCIEDDGSVLSLSRRSAYPANTEYVVFLFGDAPPYGRLGPAASAFRVNGLIVNNNGFIEDLPDTVDLRVFRERLMRIGSQPAQSLVSGRGRERYKSK